MFTKSDNICMLFTSFNYLHGKPTGLSVPLQKNNNMCRTSNQWRKLIKQNLNSIEKKQKLKDNLETFEIFMTVKLIAIGLNLETFQDVQLEK